MIIRLRNRLSMATDGYTLVTSLVLLTVLTTIGIFTLRNTTLEIMMSANGNKSTQAFEASEAARTLTSQLIEAHLDQRGWPKSAGGSIDDERFPRKLPTGLTLSKIVGESHPRNWYEGSSATSPSFNSKDLEQVDTRYSRNIPGDDATGLKLQGSAAVRVLRSDIQPGANSAMSSGYEGLGGGAANGGGDIYFYVAAQGQDPSGQATRYTAAIFRYVIRN